ncbi:hypothetical protein Tco_1359610 [Tanacetum coccineum]
MDDMNITMEEYIWLEEEKSQKRGKVFNWETAKYGKIAIRHMALPPRDQRHQYLMYEGLQYIDADIVDFETRLARIYKREVHREVSLFTSRAWRRLFDIRGPLVHELILEFFSTFRFGEAILDLNTPGALQLQLRGARRCLSWRQFIVALGLHTGEEMESPNFARYWAERMDVGSVNVPYLLARYLRLFAAGRKSGALISGGQFVALLAEHFGLLIEERLRGLIVIAPILPIIDMAELVRSQIYVEIDDTWASVALGPERQPDAAASVLGAAKDAPVVDEGDQAVPAPVQAPQQSPPPPPTAGRTMTQRLGT